MNNQEIPIEKQYTGPNGKVYEKEEILKFYEYLFDGYEKHGTLNVIWLEEDHLTDEEMYHILKQEYIELNK